MTHNALHFEHLNQNKALVFYNEHKNKINNLKFSDEIADLIKDGSIENIEYYSLLSSFTENNNILSHYILSEELVNINE